ncbi:pentatricopeptide repeat-containing protein At3g09040, mitochondrial [Selaginella moellendorffii]|uniref:pentatricopeptide repeat-containing protein At3g09040, mitochondrial n=1 Tax=Selaginella moellendorffii TaxID=88036 RepID=UPI000D1CA6AC|nr:pentatricopeptide repeat-containing protein At3g09040, mitochondrial [Selaginella moellendorffii]|eukprot:XP_024517431.1 pentatricopeptide repeat-containing protein At3g09040, mitochondrial [Selaginella moellendorffii]
MAAATTPPPLVSFFHQREEYVRLLLGRDKQPALPQLRALHARIVKSGHDSETFLRNLLLEMYGRCGSLGDARRVFDATDHKNLFTWNTMMVALVRNSQHCDAASLLHVMDLEGITPGSLILATLLSSCSMSRNLKLGNWIAVRAAATGWSSNLLVSCAAITMYSSCGRLHEACLVFETVQGRCSASWNSMIVAYTQHGHLHTALQLLEANRCDKLPPSHVLVALLGACSKTATEESLQVGRRLHSIIIHGTSPSSENDAIVYNSLVDMYAKCGSVEEAKVVFERMTYRSQVSWNAMACAYAQHGHKTEAMRVFWAMDLEGVKADAFVFPSILSCCRTLCEFKALHARIIACGHDSDVVVRNALVRLYSEFDSIDDAQNIFDSPAFRMTSNVVSWSSMIAAYARCKHARQAVACMRRMDLEGITPNSITFLCLAEALRQLGDFGLVKLFHVRAAASGCMTSMVETALIQMYASCGRIDRAQHLFWRMTRKSLTSWSVIIFELVQAGLNAEALDVFYKMASSREPDIVCLVNALGACCGSSALADGKRIHRLISDRGFECAASACVALINMYSKCGGLSNAATVFTAWLWHSSGCDNVACWTAMIAAYAQHGRTGLAVELFREMNLAGVRGNQITFTCLLHACSQCGLLEQGRLQFISILAEHGMVPTRDHYSCMADHLARAGKIEEAQDLIQTMPFQPDAAAWSSLLGACKSSGDVNRAEVVASKSMVEPGTYVLLSDTFVLSSKEAL